MKKLTALALFLVFVLSLAGCGGQAEAPTHAGLKVCIDDVCYTNTGIAVPAEPDESVIEYVELPVGGDSTVKAFARIQDGGEGYLLCLMDNEWYRFVAE